MMQIMIAEKIRNKTCLDSATLREEKVTCLQEEYYVCARKALSESILVLGMSLSLT